MSRYTILIILNTPLVIAGMLNAIVGYKLNHMGRRRFIFGMVFWLLIFASLIFVEPIYNFMFSKNLTQTEPLSLFDVIQITGIIFTFFIANKAYGKIDLLEHRVRELHQELSIKMSEDSKKKINKD